MKIRLSFLLLTFVLIPLASFAQKSTKLFKGKDLSGWYAFTPEAGKHENAAELFSVEDKMIRLYGPQAGYLMTKESFKDFTLTLDFRWNSDTSFVRRSNSINSGVMYNIPADAKDELWPRGIQFQVKKGATGDFILLQEVAIEVKGELVSPGKSVGSKRFTDAAKPIGEWNKIEIISTNGHVIQKLNGVLVNEGTHASVTEGRILLQYEGYPIDFKNIKVKARK